MADKKAKMLVAVALLSSLTAFATIFGTVSGLIHDPQHRPVQGAQVTLHAANSAWTKSISSNDSGEFRFDSVPLGEYTVTVELTALPRSSKNSSSAPAVMSAPTFRSRLHRPRRRLKLRMHPSQSIPSLPLPQAW